MNRSLPAVLVLAFLASPPPAGAQPGDERISDVIRPGLTVSIVDDEGRQTEGRVMDVSADVIRVSLRGTSEEIRLDRIVRIDKPDRLKNGALIGLGVGLSLGVIGAVVRAPEIDAKWALAGIAWNGVACTLLGTGIDALVDSRRTLYQRSGGVRGRVSPIVGRGVRGAAMTLSW